MRACFIFFAALFCTVAVAQEPPDAWKLANDNRAVHRFSTLITAQQVRDHLAFPDKLQAAIDWCKATAVTKVYIESFRDGYQAERSALIHAKERFLQAGLDVSGCITTTRVLKDSSGWKTVPCFTDQPTQEKLQALFEYAASMFDEIMIDDFLFTDCACAQCDAARKSRTVRIGQKTFPVAGDSWEDYRCELMVQLSRQRILAAAKRVNPKAKLIIKYPQWYDQFHERGYEVARQSADFDRIWVGTETRDYGDKRWGGTVPYEAYFIMRWLGGLGGEKCGGGWFDPYGTTERTYLEQARQTILAGARESVLFCYGSLLSDTGPKNVQALRANLPELFAVAAQVRDRRPVGIAAFKPASSHPEKEKRVFDFVGMLGLPLIPCHEFPADAPAAFFSVHAMKDTDFAAKLGKFIAADKPVLLTDGLVETLGGAVDLNKPNVHILPVKGDPKSLLTLPQPQLDGLRAGLLKHFNVRFRAPAQTALYLFGDGSFVIENFGDSAIHAEVDGQPHDVPARGWVYRWK